MAVFRLRQGFGKSILMDFAVFMLHGALYNNTI
jgi:hypothetical protein